MSKSILLLQEDISLSDKFKLRKALNSGKHDKLRILIFLFLFCILHECEILDAGHTERMISQLCLTPACKEAASIILQNMDRQVAPCDDFYQFACGNFTKTTRIPKDRMYVDASSFLEEKIQQQLKSSIEEPNCLNEPRFIILTKNFYKACMNTDVIEKTGLRTILGDFTKLGCWPVLEGPSWNEKNFDWKQLIYDMRKLGYDTDYLFIFTVVPDNANSSKVVLKIDQPALSIGRPTLVEGFKNKIVSAYYSFMVDVAVYFGANRVSAEKELKESLKFEIKLASISIKDEDRRNMTALDKPMTVQELSKRYPSIPWKKYLRSVFLILQSSIVIGDHEPIIVSALAFFDKFEKLIKDTPERVLANYLFWRATLDNSQYLTDKIQNRKIKFTSLIDGQTNTPPRWEECLQKTRRKLPLSIGVLYVRKYFISASKESAEELAVDIKQQLKKILKEIDWMDATTRMSALDKLESIKNLIGYPNEFFNNKKLEEFYRKLVITPNDYLHAALNVSLFLTDYYFSELRTTANKLDWRDHGDAATVNAQYDLQGNGIIVLAGTLQGIFYNKDNTQYLNYAGIGSFTIGHEMMHAFDDIGSQYDKNGNLKNWWTPESRKKFLEKAACIIQQYGNYTTEETDEKLNGVLTQGENIADNGGVKVSYLAYQDWVKRHGTEPKLPGLDYSPSQLYWIYSAVQWCSKYTPEFIKMVTALDSHSPARFRVIGAFSNRPAFAKDFNCPVGSKMNPVKKCSVW